MKLKADLQYKEVKTKNFFFRKFIFGKNTLNSLRENKIEFRRHLKSESVFKEN